MFQDVNTEHEDSDRSSEPVVIVMKNKRKRGDAPFHVIQTHSVGFLDSEYPS